eukprot:798390_1
MTRLQQVLLNLLPLLLVSNAYNVPSSSSTAAATTDRRAFFTKSATLLGTSALLTTFNPQQSNAIGPVKIGLENPTYTARICPPDRPIPGEKAMKGMKGVCVTVKANLTENSPKDLDKVG